MQTKGLNFEDSKPVPGMIWSKEAALRGHRAGT